MDIAGLVFLILGAMIARQSWRQRRMHSWLVNTVSAMVVITFVLASLTYFYRGSAGGLRSHTRQTLKQPDSGRR